MTFTSSIFLIGLLPWFIILVYLTRKISNAKKILIIIANTLFYIAGGVGALLIVCVYSLAIWIFTLIIKKNKNKALFTIFIIVSALPLALIKYTGFAIKNINTIFKINISSPSLLIPIGISFFTFEAISLICDIYKEKIINRVTFIDVYSYITFFPTITSGPILRFNQFQEGLVADINIKNFDVAIERIIIGVFKKVLIADKIAPLADYYFNGVASSNVYSVLGLWIGSIAYTLQLYFDFSGYSDIAIGIGLMMGFDIPENFNKPYRASSISDFWKRWHISLSAWFRDYIYISLGGNKCSKLKHIINLLIVWIVTGIWHGSDWTFVIWGIGYFILLTIEKYIPAMKKLAGHWWGNIYALFFINILWVPFRAEDLGATLKYIAGMFGANGQISLEEKAISFIPFLIFCIVICFPWERILQKFNDKTWYKILKGVVLIAIVVLAVCAIINATYAPYIYGNF